MRDLIERANQHDDQIIERFRNLPVLVNLEGLSDYEFKKMLLQRRFLSLHFTPFYDQAIDGLEDKEAKQVAREIVREEYPKNTPSHREELVADLLKTGLSKKDVLSARPSPKTKKTIDGLYELVSGEKSDIEIINALRSAGEVLVAEEYRFIVPELQRRYGLKPEGSAFYWTHFSHDQKQNPIGSNGKTHSDRLGNILARLIDTEEKLHLDAVSKEKAYEVKASFYEQFRVS